MGPETFLAWLTGGLVVLAALALARQRSRRQALLAQPFPEAWERVLLRNAPFFSRLPPVQQGRLRRLIQRFLAEKNFEGCGGLAITDEIRVTVGAHACRLMLGREGGLYPGLKSILVYPSSYRAPVRDRVGPMVIEGHQERLGESWQHGAVVLAWDPMAHTALAAEQRGNVVLHEFAHQIDTQDGEADGVPTLGDRRRYAAWARALSEAYRDLQTQVETGQTSVLDAYGTENPAEFFAVATEYFFEKPRALERRYPKLYEQLRSFYGQDPS